MIGEIASSSSVHLGRADELKTRRDKRVLWGEPLMDVRSYEVARFFVYITNGRCGANLGGWFNWYLGKCEPPPVGTLECGGALIAENVVQTACHCMVIFNQEESSNGDLTVTTTPQSVWENPFAMYLGYYDVHEMIGGSRPRQFIHHQKCKAYQSEIYNLQGTQLSYDFGIILTKKPLIKPERFTRQAPIYTVPELKSLFIRQQKEQKVCLIAGFGWYKMRDHLKSGYPSRYFQHAWNRVLSYIGCYKASGWLRKYLQYFGRKRGITYENVSTWFCTKSFGKFIGAIGGGDSGSPITCDDHYMGLVSSSLGPDYMRKRMYKNIYGVISAIRYTERENAAEYRRGFLKKVLDIYVYATDLPPTRHHELSHGSHFYCHHQLFMLIVVIIKFIF